MKRLISIILSFFLLGSVFAYTPTSDDLSLLSNLKTQLNQTIGTNMNHAWKFQRQVKNLQENFSSHERVNYLLNDLNIYLTSKITTEKTKAKLASKADKQTFLNTYISGISLDITAADSCTGWYNTLDTMSFVNDFPTALTIATWYRETNCGYYLPKNGWGPFQIISKNYGTGEISENTFIQSVQDFIDFSKAKHTQYHSKLGIEMSYTGFDYTGIINHSALYNGASISGNIAYPINPEYVFDGYNELTGATRYGVFPKFLKTLQWELGTTY